MTKTIYLGSDHAGFKLKEKIKKWLNKQKIPFEDLGNLKYDPKDDYPDFAKKVARKVAKTKSLGVLICGTGQGMCIAANKIKGIIAAYCYDKKTAKHAKEHLNANIICMGGINQRTAKNIVQTWLKTKVSQEPRHIRRLNKIRKLR